VLHDMVSVSYEEIVWILGEPTACEPGSSESAAWRGIQPLIRGGNAR
jgi:hypothetical protein